MTKICSNPEKFFNLYPSNLAFVGFLPALTIIPHLLFLTHAAIIDPERHENSTEISTSASGFLNLLKTLYVVMFETLHEKIGFIKNPHLFLVFLICHIASVTLSH